MGDDKAVWVKNPKFLYRGDQIVFDIPFASDLQGIVESVSPASLKVNYNGSIISVDHRKVKALLKQPDAPILEQDVCLDMEGPQDIE